MLERLKSRKFWMAVISALILVGNDGLGLNLPAESIMSVAGIVAAYVLGQGLADARKE